MTKPYFQLVRHRDRNTDTSVQVRSLPKFVSRTRSPRALITRTSVAATLKSGFIVTFTLALGAIAIATVAGLGLGTVGGLGRPRWLGYGTWHSGPLLRECKTLVASGWTRAHRGEGRSRLNDIARGRFRSPDPWYAATGNLLIRRLSPNNRKIDVEDRRDAARLLHPDLLWAMGRDLAAIHLGVRDRREALRKDLAKRKARWFRTSVETAAEFVNREYAGFKKSAK